MMPSEIGRAPQRFPQTAPGQCTAYPHRHDRNLLNRMQQHRGGVIRVHHVNRPRRFIVPAPDRPPPRRLHSSPLPRSRCLSKSSSGLATIHPFRFRYRQKLEIHHRSAADQSVTPTRSRHLVDLPDYLARPRQGISGRNRPSGPAAATSVKTGIMSVCTLTDRRQSDRAATACSNATANALARPEV